MAEDLSPELKVEFEAIRATGDMEELKKFVSTYIICPRDGKPANFGDGSKMPPCPSTSMAGGRRRRRRTTKRSAVKKKNTKRRSAKRSRKMRRSRRRKSIRARR